MPGVMEAIKKIIFGKNKLNRFVYACKACLRYPDSSLYPVGRYQNMDIDACVQNYINNIETARYHAHLLGAKYLNFLQPFNGVGRGQLSRFDVNSIAHFDRRLTFSGKTEFDLIVKFYDKVWERVKDKGYVFDLRHIFADYDGEIYFDHAHCSDTGYDLIAKKIAQKILDSEQGVLQDSPGKRRL
jgi:hypothetical protein